MTVIDCICNHTHMVVTIILSGIKSMREGIVCIGYWCRYQYWPRSGLAAWWHQVIIWSNF